jgi:hypothetical protein
MLIDTWSDWQQQVIAAIRVDLRDVLDDVGTDDVDWDAWRPLFDEGRTPQAAVAKAFLRDVQRSS